MGAQGSVSARGGVKPAGERTDQKKVHPGYHKFSIKHSSVLLLFQFRTATPSCFSGP